MTLFGNIADGHVHKIFLSQEAKSIFKNLRLFIPLNVWYNPITAEALFFVGGLDQIGCDTYVHTCYVLMLTILELQFLL